MAAFLLYLESYFIKKTRELIGFVVVTKAQLVT